MGTPRWREKLFRGCLNVNYGTNRERDFFRAATGGRRVGMSGRGRASRPLSPRRPEGLSASSRDRPQGAIVERNDAPGVPRPVTLSQPALVCCVGEPE